MSMWADQYLPRPMWTFIYTSCYTAPAQALQVTPALDSFMGLLRGPSGPSPALPVPLWTVHVSCGHRTHLNLMW